MRFLGTVVVNAVGIWVATLLLPGISVGPEGGTTTTVITYLAIGLVFGLVNAVIRPIVVFFSLPFYLLTLGLFSVVVNALMLWLTAGISRSVGLSFHIENFFWQAILGAVVVAVVGVVGHALLDRSDQSERV